MSVQALAAEGPVEAFHERVVDPATGNILGTFEMPPNANFRGGRCALDLANERVFLLGQTLSQLNAEKGVTIGVFDATTYRLLSTLTLPDVAGSSPVDFVRWGKAGLAFTVFSPSSQNPPNPRSTTLYLLDGSFVSANATPDFTNGTPVAPLPSLISMSPQSAAAGSSSATLTINGANFGLASQVQWNGAALQTTYVSASQLQAAIPASDLSSPGSALITVTNSSSTPNQAAQTSLAFTITPASGTTQLTAVNLAALDIAFDSSGSHLIAPVWSADPQYANSIVAVDPATGDVVQSAAVYSDPDLVRVTSDSNSVYAAYSNANWVTQLSLPNLIAPSSFALSDNLSKSPYCGPDFAIDLQPAPGADGTTAVALGYECGNPDEAGIAIFDNGTLRPTEVPGFGAGGNQYDFIQWGSSDAALYATDSSTNIDNFYSFAVDSSGITLSEKSNVIGATPIHFDATTGLIYANSGQVLNPNTMTLVGTYNASGLLTVDSTLGRVFILGQTSSQSGTTNYTLQSFSQTQFTAISSIMLPSIVGTPVAMTRWGSSGLAFVTYNKSAGTAGGPAGVLYIISDSSFVSSDSRSSESSGRVEHVQMSPRDWPFATPTTGRALPQHQDQH